MIEQEIASIMRFILDNTDSSSLYYHNMPENFSVPATYFPVPELTSSGDTLLTFALEYVIYAKFFDVDSQSAYHRANQAVVALQTCRNVVPLIDTNGNQTSDGIRLKDPSANGIDEGVAQIVLVWDSRRPYSHTESPKATGVEFDIFNKSAYKPPNLSEALIEAAGIIDNQQS